MLRSGFTRSAFLSVWLVGGLIATIGALSFAELGAMLPLVGGEYAFLREGWHPLIGFLYGWTLLLVISPGGTSAVTMKFAQTLSTLAPGLASPRAVKLTGLAAIWALTIVNYFGVKPGAMVQNIFTSGKLGALALLIGFGFLAEGNHTQTPTSPYEGSAISAFGAALAP